MNIIKPAWAWNGVLIPLVLKNVTGIAIHHAAAIKASVVDIDNWHKARNWKGIGYSWYLPKDGYCYEGRGLTVGGGLADPLNETVISICLEGNFEVENPTLEQLKTLTELLTWLKPQLPNLVEIDGHNHWMATACPGKNFPLEQFKIGGTRNMTLQKGSQGLEVVSLQIRLNKLGYNLVEDGDFGPGTEKAVKQFQTNVNLYPDGVVGSFTMAALESEIIKNTAPPELDYKKLYLELKENIRKLVI